MAWRALAVLLGHGGAVGLAIEIALAAAALAVLVLLWLAGRREQAEHERKEGERR